jgi:hypothetical protein
VDRKAFRLDRPLTMRELGLACAALGLLALLAYAPLVLHGGYHLDDWYNGAETLYPPGGRSIGHSLGRFVEYTLFRPVLILYVPLTYVVFGVHQHWLLAWSVVLALGGIWLFYAILRRLGVPWIHALAIAGLVLIFPWSDSTRIMPSAGVISLAIFFLMTGTLVALIGLDRRDRRLHWVAAAFFLLSILSYEITLAVIAALGVIYLLRAGWREARWRWALDLAAVLIGGVWNLTHTARSTSSISGDWKHLGEIIDGGSEILAQTALPTRAPQTALVLLATAVVLGAGLAVLWWQRRGAGAPGAPLSLPTPSGWGLREWLLMAGGGTGVFVLGWIVFIPADPYYTPAIWGVTNRVNGMAAFGTVLTVYATLGVLGTLLGRLLRGSRPAAVAVTIVLGLGLGVGYEAVLHRHIVIWNSAWVAEEKALDQITGTYPTLPPGAMVVVGNYPSNQTLGVPILSTTWDLKGMLKLRYETSTVTGYPLQEGWTMKCLPEGFELDAGGKRRRRRYGLVRLMNLEAGAAFSPSDRASCQAAVAQLAPGPLYLSYEY